MEEEIKDRDVRTDQCGGDGTGWLVSVRWSVGWLKRKLVTGVFVVGFFFFIWTGMGIGAS